MCELLHTVSANQTCSSVDPSFGAGPLALNAQRPPITGVPGAFIALGGHSLTHRLEVHFPGKPGCAASGSGREPTSIQNDSGLLRPIQVCPMDLPIRSVAG
jgi:hypothetical protein